jgi:hypothetical protein
VKFLVKSALEPVICVTILPLTVYRPAAVAPKVSVAVRATGGLKATLEPSGRVTVSVQLTTSLASSEIPETDVIVAPSAGEEETMCGVASGVSGGAGGGGTLLDVALFVTG